MTQASRTFRLFVSSTFSDLKAERNALQARVFPRLRALCQQYGVRFQAIDLRWGVSEQASLDHRTIDICLKEIARCQQTTPRPNFTVLLGDRYGWCPPPPHIRASEFEAILERTSEADRALLQTWYRRDENAVPPEYNLRPRERGRGVEAYEDWAPIEARLRAILVQAVAALDLDAEARLKYGASATHQEIAAGALQVEDADAHVFCFFRETDSLPPDERAAGFLDLTAGGEPDVEAQSQLRGLKDELRRLLPQNVHQYPARWTDDGVTIDHLDALCEDVYQSLAAVIRREMAQLEEMDPLQAEVAEHRAFGKQRAEFFVGRTRILRTIGDYVAGTAPHPLAVWGRPGSGKSASMAKAVDHAHNAHPDAVVIYRFIGATPASSNGWALLESLCRQVLVACDLERQRAERLSEIEGTDETAQARRQEIRDDYAIPPTFQELSGTFKRFLSMIPDGQRLVLFLDGLDQLAEADNARGLTWLPTQLPGNVRLVVSTTTGRCKERLDARLPAEAVVELEPMPTTEAEELLDLWLDGVGRTLQDRQRREVLTKFAACPRPLYLRLAFEEARRWRSYDGVATGADGRSGLGEDIPGIIRDLFTRLSSDQNHGSVLVSRSLGYLAAARNGLTEDELLDVLSRDVTLYARFLENLYHTPPDLLMQTRAALEGDRARRLDLAEGEPVTDEAAEAFLASLRSDPLTLERFLAQIVQRPDGPRLPVVLWSRLYADLEPYLALRSADGTSVLGFYHQQVEQVVRADFLDGTEAVQRHRSLADYFGPQELQNEQDDQRVPNLRKLSELPYQQTHARLWDDLKATLLDFEFLDAKVRAVGPQSLIEDYGASFRAGCADPGLALVRGALRLSAHILDRDRRQTAAQLTGRLISQENPDIQALLKQIRAWRGGPWLRPLTPSLTPPGGALLRTLDHGGPITGIVVLESGRRALSASDDGTHGVWDLEAGVELRTLKRRDDAFTLHEVLPDGRRVVSSSEGGTIEVWDLETEETVCLLKGHTDHVQAVAVFDAGRRAISASSDQTLRVWDLDTGVERRALKGHSGSVSAVAVLDDGRRAISASTDWTLRLWDLETGETLRTLQLKGHSEPALVVAITDDGQQAICGCMDGTLRRWNLERGAELELIGRHGDPISALTILEGGQRAMSGSWDGMLKVWDLETGRNLRTLEAHPSRVKGVAAFDDGRRAISASSGGALQVWDLEVRDNPVAAERVTAIAIFPDGRRALSVANATRALRGDRLGMRFLKVWDLQTGLRLRTLQVRAAWLNAVAVFDGGRRAITASDDRSLCMWDLKSGQGLPPLTGHTDYVKAVVVFDEGLRAISGSWDHTLKVWDLEAWMEVATLRGHSDHVNAVAVFDGGRRAISASSDQTLKVWDLEKGEELRTLEGHSGRVESVAVTPDGCRAISGSWGEIKVWDLETGEQLHALRGHSGVVNAVATFGDGRLAVAASGEGTVLVWDLESGALIASFVGEAASMECCAVTSDGSRIVAGGVSGRVHILEPRESRGGHRGSD